MTTPILHCMTDQHFQYHWTICWRLKFSVGHCQERGHMRMHIQRCVELACIGMPLRVSLSTIQRYIHVHKLAQLNEYYTILEKSVTCRLHGEIPNEYGISVHIVGRQVSPSYLMSSIRLSTEPFFEDDLLPFLLIFTIFFEIVQ